MVGVEDITEKEQIRKDKIRKTKNLLGKYFPNSDMEIVNSIHVFEKEKSHKHILTMEINNRPTLTLFFQNYWISTINFVKEYESHFESEQVNIETDYSDLLDLS